MSQLKLRITGRVQGVSFRWYAKQQADALGITGYAKNLPDGSVEIVAEGPERKLEAFVAWCRKGPAAAQVQNVEIVSRGRAEGSGEFQIVH